MIWNILMALTSNFFVTVYINTLYISHILDSGNEKGVLPRRCLFFSEWWLWEGSSDKKRVLPWRYPFFSKFVACCTVYLWSSFTIKPTLLCGFKLTMQIYIIHINYCSYCLNWSYSIFRLLCGPTVSRRWEERTPELLLQIYWMRFW